MAPAHSIQLTVLSKALAWPPLQAQRMQHLDQDWHGAPFAPAARYQLVEDPSHLWLLAARQLPAKPHSTSDCGDFQEGLWRHDVAELFITGPHGEAYLEFNLSPRGAWWAAAFSAPRVPTSLNKLPTVRCESRCGEEGAWLAALGIPLDWLTEAIAWGEGSRANVSFILESPEQQFLSACDLGNGEPDFHRPQHFAQLERCGD